MNRIATALFLTMLLVVTTTAQSSTFCAPAVWQPEVAPDFNRLVQYAERVAAAGDPAAQWLVGSIYLLSEDAERRNSGMKWLQIAAHTVVKTQPKPKPGELYPPLSETELYAVMRETVDALPRLVAREGSVGGAALFYAQTRGILQGLMGCMDRH